MPEKRRARATKWTEALDKTQVREAYEDAVIDAYDEYEQHSGLLTMIENEVSVPSQSAR